MRPISSTENHAWGHPVRPVTPDIYSTKLKNATGFERNFSGGKVLKIERKEHEAFGPPGPLVQMDIFIVVFRVGGLAETESFGFLLGARQFNEKAAVGDR